MKNKIFVCLTALFALTAVACNETDAPNEEPTKALTAEDVLKNKRIETDNKIKEILNSSNMKISQRKIVYYVSNDGSDSNNGLTEETPWKTLDKVNAASLQKGYYVCFRRGDIWRGELICQEGVTYTAYGSGAKPAIYGSPFNGGSPDFWTQTSTPNVWKLAANFDKDLGAIVLNDGESTMKKVMLAEKEGNYYNMTKYRYDGFDTGFVGCDPWTGLECLVDGEFYHDSTTPNHTDEVYVYCTENPGRKYKSIEFNTYNPCVSTDKNSVKIDNLCLKYSGSLGVSGMNVAVDGGIKNLKVTNCEIAYIGGSINEVYRDMVEPVRYGNGIQIYGPCDGFTCTSNYVHQIYDTCITPQFTMTGMGTKDCSEVNILINKNVMEYYNYGVEYFIRSIPEGNKSVYSNFYIENNYFWYAGYGLSEQRPNYKMSTHIYAQYGPSLNRCSDPIVIQDNFMALAREWILFTDWCATGTEYVNTSHPEYNRNTIVDYYSPDDNIDTSVLGFYGYSAIGGDRKLCHIAYWKAGEDRWKHWWENAIFYNEKFETFINSQQLDEDGNPYQLGTGNKCYFLKNGSN